MRFDHAGLATDDAAALADLYADLFDAPVVHEEEFDGLRVVFLELDGGYFRVVFRGRKDFFGTFMSAYPELWTS